MSLVSYISLRLQPPQCSHLTWEKYFQNKGLQIFQIFISPFFASVLIPIHLTKLLDVQLESFTKNCSLSTHIRPFLLQKCKSENSTIFILQLLFLLVICIGTHAQMGKIAMSSLRHLAVHGFKCTCKTVKQNLSTNVKPSESSCHYDSDRVTPCEVCPSHSVLFYSV